MDQFAVSPVSHKDKTMNFAFEGKRLHEAIIDSTEICIISTSPLGVITGFNHAAEKLLGFSAEDIVGKTTLEIFFDVAEIRQRAHAVSEELGVIIPPGFPVFVARLKGKGKSDQQEWTCIRKDGTRIPAIVSISSLWEDDEVIGYSVIATEITDLKKIQRKNEESEAQLQAILSSIDDIVFELDEELRYRNIWVRSDDFLFLPREKVYGRTVTELFGETFGEPFEEGLRTVQETGNTFVWEYETPAAGEDLKYYSATCSLIYQNGNRTRRIGVCIKDITVRKKIELSLQKSEVKFRSLAENLPGVVYLMDASQEWPLLYINEKIGTITGIDAEQFLTGESVLDALIHPEDELYVKNVRAKSLEENLGFQLEYRIRNIDGTWRWVSETGIALRSTDGHVLVEGYIHDISQRKESEEEMRRMADENSRIFNNSLTLSSVTAFDGYLKKINPAWEKLLGWTRDELQSRPFLSFIHPDDVNKTAAMIEAMSGGQNINSLENRFRAKDGSFRWLLWACSPDIARKVFYASAIDITSRKKSEDELLLSKRNLEVAASELEEQNHQLDEFSHIISHNLRAPVHNIKALLNFINDSSTVQDYQLIFEKIRNVTFNISETMNELLETISIRKNHEIERVEIRFKDILDKVIQSLEGELIESGASITYNFNNAPKIYYAKPYLESILQNLLSNALKYRSPVRTPQIFVSTDLVPSGIELRVKDNGLGIDLEKYGNKLFGLHKTFHENKEAKGVGLFLTKTQIETMGGNIIVESEVDKGSTFIVHF